jgi:hypothetical protein
MQNKIIGLVKEIGQFLVGEVVQETHDSLVLQGVVMLGISGDSNAPTKANIQPIPVDLLSMNPPLGVRNLIKNPTAPLVVRFKKEHLLFYDLELQDHVVQSYMTFMDNMSRQISLASSQAVEGSPSTPDDNIVKLF